MLCPCAEVTCLAIPSRVVTKLCHCCSVHCLANPPRDSAVHCCCCSVPHLAIAFPSMRTYAAALLSDLCFTLPLLCGSPPCPCGSIRNDASPSLCTALRASSEQCHRIACCVIAFLRLCFAFKSSLCHRGAWTGYAMLLHFSSKQRRCMTVLFLALPQLSFFPFFLGKDNR